MFIKLFHTKLTVTEALRNGFMSIGIVNLMNVTLSISSLIVYAVLV